MTTAHSHPSRTLQLMATLYGAIRDQADISLTSSAGELEGRFSRAPSGLRVDMASPSRPAAGELVCLEYGPATGRVRMYATVKDTDAAGVALEAPLAVELAERRESPRWLAPRNFWFEIEDAPLESPVALRDIGRGGLCLSGISPDRGPGQRLAGTLSLGAFGTMTCVLEIRHLLLRHGTLQAGCAFVDLRLRDRVRLERLLETLGQPQH